MSFDGMLRKLITIITLSPLEIPLKDQDSLATNDSPMNLSTGCNHYFWSHQNINMHDPTVRPVSVCFTISSGTE